MIIIYQVFLVTGGHQYPGTHLDSTEILEDQTVRDRAPLPSGRYGLRAATVDNTIFIFGRNMQDARYASYD